MRHTVTLLLALGLLSSCAYFSNDPSLRTPGTIIDDTGIESLVKREIRRSSPDYKGSHIVVVAFNGVVVIAGQVASEALREQAGRIARGVKRVRKVHNELTVDGPTSVLARTNDAWITTKVKSRLIANREAVGRKIKVQTENGVVYLLGLITREQAEDATAVAQNVFGVRKIVKVFEYLEETAASES